MIKKGLKVKILSGKLIIEIGNNQKYTVINLLNTNNFFVNKIIKDLSSHDRCIVSTKII